MALEERRTQPGDTQNRDDGDYAGFHHGSRDDRVRLDLRSKKYQCRGRQRDQRDRKDHAELLGLSIHHKIRPKAGRESERS